MVAATVERLQPTASGLGELLVHLGGESFGALKFAAPEGGIVTVTYPIDFSP